MTQRALLVKGNIKMNGSVLYQFLAIKFWVTYKITIKLKFITSTLLPLWIPYPIWLQRNFWSMTITITWFQTTTMIMTINSSSIKRLPLNLVFVRKLNLKFLTTKVAQKIPIFHLWSLVRKRMKLIFFGNMIQSLVKL